MFKKVTQQIWISTGYWGGGGGIELSNNARGHPIACILPLDCLTSDFWIWGYPHCFWIPHLPEMICVCVPVNPLMYTNTHTHTHARTHTHTHTHTYKQFTNLRQYIRYFVHVGLSAATHRQFFLRQNIFRAFKNNDRMFKITSNCRYV